MALQPTSTPPTPTDVPAAPPCNHTPVNTASQGAGRTGSPRHVRRPGPAALSPPPMHLPRNSACLREGGKGTPPLRGMCLLNPCATTTPRSAPRAPAPPLAQSHLPALGPHQVLEVHVDGQHELGGPGGAGGKQGGARRAAGGRRGSRASSGGPQKQAVHAAQHPHPKTHAGRHPPPPLLT